MLEEGNHSPLEPQGAPPRPFNTELLVPTSDFGLPPAPRLRLAETFKWEPHLVKCCLFALWRHAVGGWTIHWWIVSVIIIASMENTICLTGFSFVFTVQFPNNINKGVNMNVCKVWRSDGVLCYWRRCKGIKAPNGYYSNWENGALMCSLDDKATDTRKTACTIFHLVLSSHPCPLPPALHLSLPRPLLFSWVCSTPCLSLMCQWQTIACGAFKKEFPPTK